MFIKLMKIGLGRVGPAIGAVLFSLYVASELSVHESDVFFVWFTVVYVLSFLGKLGFDTYVIKGLGVNALNSASACKRTVALVSMSLACLSLPFAPKEIFFLLYSLPAFCLVSINSSVLRVEGREILGGGLEVSLLSSMAFFFLFVINKLGWIVTIDLVSQAFAISAVSVLVLGEFLVGKRHSLIGSGKMFLSPILGLRFVPSPFMIFLAQWLAVFFLSSAGAGTVSIYSIAVRLASGFAFVAITVDAFVAPRFARFFRDHDQVGINNLIKIIRRKALFFLLVAFVLYAILGWYCVSVYVDGYYACSFFVSLIIAASYCAILIIGPYQYLLLMGEGAQAVNLCNGISLLLVASGASLLWIFSVEYVWAYALVVAVGRVVGVLLMRYFSQKKYGYMYDGAE